MILPSDDPPLSEEDTVLALRTYFFELQSAHTEFEALWYTTGRGELLPEEQTLGRVLGAIAGRAELIEQAFVSLRLLREHPHLTVEPKRPR